MHKYAVRIALTSGLSRRLVADDLGVDFSTLNKWVNAHRDTDVVSAEDREITRKNEGLRREVRILKGERDILKKRHPVLREQKAVRFRFVEEQRWAFPIDRNHPASLSITHISNRAFALSDSLVILFVTPIRGGVTEERGEGSQHIRPA